MTVPQHMSALERANAVRLARAQLKRDVKAGAVSIRDALDADCARRMRVLDLLAWQRGWGPVRAGKLLRRAGCSERLLVEQLTDRQRQVLGRLG